MRPKKADGSWLEELNGREQEIVKEGEHSYYKYFDPVTPGSTFYAIGSPLLGKVTIDLGNS